MVRGRIRRHASAALGGFAVVARAVGWQSQVLSVTSPLSRRRLQTHTGGSAVRSTPRFYWFPRSSRARPGLLSNRIFPGPTGQDKLLGQNEARYPGFLEDPTIFFEFLTIQQANRQPADSNP